MVPLSWFLCAARCAVGFVFLVSLGCGGAGGDNMDAGTPDAGTPDAGRRDAATPAEAGVPDSGRADGGVDGGSGPDAGSMDSGRPDAGDLDGGIADAGTDSGAADAGVSPACGARPATTSSLDIADLTGIDVSGSPGLSSPGFRCRSYTICPIISPSCVYFASGITGSYQSSERFYDGDTQSVPIASRLYIGVGANSACAPADARITIAPCEYMDLMHDGTTTRVYLPAGTYDMSTDLTLYLADDGSSWFDGARTSFAAGAP